MSEKMQSVMHGLMGLVPLVGPAIIMRDGLWGGERTNL